MCLDLAVEPHQAANPTQAQLFVPGSRSDAGGVNSLRLCDITGRDGLGCAKLRQAGIVGMVLCKDLKGLLRGLEPTLSPLLARQFGQQARRVRHERQPFLQNSLRLPVTAKPGEFARPLQPTSYVGRVFRDVRGIRV
ncbi:hypothetical protein C7I84_23880 [Mesorhizobium ephedrae]|uniref:Uncharacterized protein n=1 Tax=Kumtagia ephedrae TaxID=2116701 RepID=A0A2P7RXG6_9HYPH|nr:hypothetical protein C7I84_23880 [Mesorhizobium ephedrae]